jgi:hypothetical protein
LNESVYYQFKLLPSVISNNNTETDNTNNNRSYSTKSTPGRVTPASTLFSPDSHTATGKATSASANKFLSSNYMKIHSKISQLQASVSSTTGGSGGDDNTPTKSSSQKKDVNNTDNTTIIVKNNDKNKMLTFNTPPKG